jgi:hypothetical protein
MTHILAAATAHYPAAAVQLFVIYVSQFPRIPDPYPVVDHFLSCSGTFRNIPAGAQYLQALYYLVDRYPAFKQARFGVVRKFFTRFMKSCNLMIIGTAIRAVCATLDDEFHIPFDAVCRALHHRETFSIAVSLLLRIKAYPSSKTLVRQLADNAAKEPRLFVVLCIFAEQGIENARLVVQNLKWMQAKTIDAFRLFLVLFTQLELRPALVVTHQWPVFIAKLAELGGEEVLAAIAIVMRRCELNQTHLEALAEATFFHRYYEALKNTDDKHTLHAANAMLDRIARAGFVAEFALFVPLLEKMLAMKNELTSGAAVVIVTFSCFPTIAESFKGTVLAKYFMALLKNPKFTEKAQLFLRNVGEN